MITKLSQLEDQLKTRRTSKVAVACPYESELLKALKEGLDNDIIIPILVGDKNKIEDASKLVDLDLKKCEIVEAIDEIQAAEIATKLVSEGKAASLMKGLLSTSTILKAALNKEWGLRSKSSLAHLALFEHPKKGLIAAIDCAVNPTHSKEKLIQIIDDAIHNLKKIHGRKIRVALISASEKVNDKIETSIMQGEIVKEYKNPDAIMAGPYAIDNAISKKACQIKDITGEVAGQADLLVFPDLVSGNVFYKTMIYLANAKLGGMIMGAKAPIILTSRADSDNTKSNSIYLAQFLAGGKENA